jgi:hypothetical protein
MMTLESVLYDFGREGAVAGWSPISDTVMGGLSTASLDRTSHGTAIFRGRVSLENDGGFASIRSRPRDYDLQGFSALVLDVRGDGRRYRINLKTDVRFDGVLYRSELTGTPEWRTVTLPFDHFVPVLRGRRVPDAPALDPSRVRSIGLMVSDGPGEFRLELRSIKATAG